MALRGNSHDAELWPARTWRTAGDDRLLPRTSVLVAGEDDLPMGVLRRCVRTDDALVVGPLTGFDDVVEEVEARQPDLVLLCGTTDDLRLHAAMHALHGREGTTRLALIVRLGRATRCLLLGDVDPPTEDLLLRIAGEDAEGRPL